MFSDSAARERALNTSTSFIVQAPAGSGKTELLIQRYLKLLTTVEVPDAVVAITFTRKAAGEMRMRVLHALRNAAAGVTPEQPHQQVTHLIARSVLDHDHHLGWSLLRNPAQLRIETIDALCAAITQRMPWMARFGAMPGIIEKAEDLYHQAAQNTLRHVEEEHPALSYLLLHLDNDFYAARRLISSMLEKRDQWLRHTGVNPDFVAVRQELESSLQRLILDQLQRLRAGFTNEAIAEISLLRQLQRFPDARLEDLELWQSVAGMLLTNNGEWRKRVDKTMGFPPTHPLKSRMEQLLARLRREDELLEALCRLRELPAPQFTDSQWQAMESAVSVLTLAVAELQMVFSERGLVDFPELSIRASQALGTVDSPTDLGLALGYRIQHLLIDEFQDTSYTQYELLKKLTAGWDPGDSRTLFLVGDPMQSIYRFRQADVSLFLKARLEGIGNIRLEPLILAVNFRSRPAIVDWVNRMFHAILPPKDDLESGAVGHSPSVAGTSGEDATIAINTFADTEEEAAHVGALAKSGFEGTTAILVRSRAHLTAIAGVLKSDRIPYQAIEIDQLGERPVIEDLVALTLALLHPADRVSWLAILRAPWCGLTLQDLHALAGADHRSAVWDLLHAETLPVSADGTPRIRRILPVLEQAIAQRGRAPLRDWVEGIWRQLGGPDCVSDPADLEDASSYFELLEQLQEGVDLADFGWFREQVNALFAQPNPTAGDKFQLMTIHKAKGLEFDTVILPGLGSKPRPEDASLLLWLEQPEGLLLAPISESGKDQDPIYKYLQGLERRKSGHETARLLYVAATRARRTLHLLGCVEASNSQPSAGSFLKLLWPEVSATVVASSQHETSTTDVAKAPQAIRRLPLDWKAPAPHPAITWTPLDARAAATPRVTYEWVGDRLRYAGTALHRFLEKIAREGVDAWEGSTIRSRHHLYRAVLSNLGVPPHDLPETVNLVETALLRTLRDPRGRWILDRHQDADCELRITGLLDGRLHEAIVDRTFIDEEGIRWIIDYKTSAHQGGDLQTFLNSEQDRYREQLGIYARLLVQREDRPIRLALYFPLLGEWREWAAPIVLRKQASLFEL